VKKIAIALSPLLLAACVTPGQFREGIDSLNGKPVSVAVDKLGLPTSEQTVAGMRLVKWSVVSGSEYQCTVTLQIDDQNIIRRGSGDGNLGGCENYIRALKR
jgi:hypothetical protein